MEKIKQGDDEYLENVKIQYRTAISRCLELLGEDGFVKKRSIDSRKKFINSTLFEVWMVSLARLNKSEYIKLKIYCDTFRSMAKKLLDDVDFLNSITYSTQKVDHVKVRYDKLSKLIKEVLHA